MPESMQFRSRIASSPARKAGIDDEVCVFLGAQLTAIILDGVGEIFRIIDQIVNFVECYHSDLAAVENGLLDIGNAGTR